MENGQEQEKTEKKGKFALYIYDSSLDVARQWYKRDNCKSISEFIEKAIWYLLLFNSYTESFFGLPTITAVSWKTELYWCIFTSYKKQTRTENAFRPSEELLWICLCQGQR